MSGREARIKHCMRRGRAGPSTATTTPVSPSSASSCARAASASTVEVQWRPRGGIEGLLVDSMAQAFTLYLLWLARHHL